MSVGKISAGELADVFAVVAVTGGTVVVVVVNTSEAVVVVVTSGTVVVVVVVTGSVVVIVGIFTVLVGVTVVVEFLPLQPVTTITSVIRTIVPNRKNFFN